MHYETNDRSNFKKGAERLEKLNEDSTGAKALPRPQVHAPWRMGDEIMLERVLLRSCYL
jgi:hypothetical protein